MGVIVCRRPNPDEAAALCALAKHVIAVSFPRFPPEAVEAYLRPWTPEAVASRLRDGQDILIAAVDGDKVIGLISGTAPEGGVGTIIWLLVDPRWRGRGTGRALHEAACLAYRELGAHKMKLTAPSEATKRFYESRGMQVEGFHPTHWYGMDFYSLGVILDGARGGLDHRYRITVEPPMPPEREP